MRRAEALEYDEGLSYMKTNCKITSQWLCALKPVVGQVWSQRIYPFSPCLCFGCLCNRLTCLRGESTEKPTQLLWVWPCKWITGVYRRDEVFSWITDYRPPKWCLLKSLALLHAREAEFGKSCYRKLEGSWTTSLEGSLVSWGRMAGDHKGSQAYSNRYLCFCSCRTPPPPSPVFPDPVLSDFTHSLT